MASDVLQLTGIICAGEQPNTYIGHIKEIGGILAQGATEQEVYDNLVETTKHMIEVYKRKEALALMASQNKQHTSESFVDEEGALHFNLNKQLVAC